jgi:hypothetical protein
LSEGTKKVRWAFVAVDYVSPHLCRPNKQTRRWIYGYTDAWRANQAINQAKVHTYMLPSASIYPSDFRIVTADVHVWNLGAQFSKKWKKKRYLEVLKNMK